MASPKRKRQRVNRAGKSAVTPNAPSRLIEKPFILRLSDLIYEDLRAKRHGLSWITNDIALSILLGDHLIGAVEAVISNIREADHHLACFLTDQTALDKLTNRHNRSAVAQGESVSPIGPPTPERERLLLDRDCSVAGFFRAIGSVVDNLATVVAITAALPIEVVERFTWPNLKRAFEATTASGAGRLQQILFELGIDTTIRSSGPPGWLEWAVEMRNMLVHRPRRIWTSTLAYTPDLSGKYGSMKSDLLLPTEPSLTTIEVMRDAANFPGSLLTEPAQNTMEGILASVQLLTEAVCAYAGTLIQLRVGDPGLLTQPLEQWREKSVLPRRGEHRFGGFGGHAEPIDSARALQTNESLLMRMQSAAVLDAQDRARWTDWLAASESSRPTRAQRRASRKLARVQSESVEQ